ncbi:hypothetical protein EE612_002359, partial [Oryza sativa]
AFRRRAIPPSARACRCYGEEGAPSLAYILHVCSPPPLVEVSPAGARALAPSVVAAPPFAARGTTTGDRLGGRHICRPFSHTCSCCCSGKWEKNEEEERVEADMWVPLSYT